MTPVLRPHSLSQGDLVAIAGLSGPFVRSDEPLLARAVTVIEQMGFRVQVSPLVSADRRRWWAAGSAREQADELNGLLRDPDVRAIVAHLGGNATFGYLDLLDLDAVRADPKPIFGYSDISVLHLALHARTGLVGFHGEMATRGFGDDWFARASEERRASLVNLYTRVLTKSEALGALPADGAWECWRPGRVEGRLVGGLLNRIVRLQGTPFAVPPERFDGAILFWEEIGRPLEWVWNDLHTLRLSGVLDRIAGMVIGIPTNVISTHAGLIPPTLREVVLDAVGARDLPVLGQVDFGHSAPNLPLPIGILAELDATDLRLSLLEPAVG